jgi:MraZ protein
VSGFVGRFEHTLDDKGRLILPSRWRPEFPVAAYLTHYFETCLALYSEADFERQSREILALVRDGTEASRARAREWSDGVSQVVVDRQGRLVIPQKSRSFADLVGEIVLLGQLDHIELWSPSRLATEFAKHPSFLGGSGSA